MACSVTYRCWWHCWYLTRPSFIQITHSLKKKKWGLWMTTCFGSSHFVRASQFFLHRSFPSKCFPGQPQRGGRTFFTNEKAKCDAKESAEWKLWRVCSERSFSCLTEAVTQCFLWKTWHFPPCRRDQQCGFSLPLAFPSPGSKVTVAATEMFACLEASCLLRFSMWLHVDAL